MKSNEELFNKMYISAYDDKYSKDFTDAVNNFMDKLHQSKITLNAKIPSTYSYKDLVNSYMKFPPQPFDVVIDSPGASYTQIKPAPYLSSPKKNIDIEIDHSMTTEELIYDEIDNPGKWGGLDNIRKQKGE